jgi:hypothetical protein
MRTGYWWESRKEEEPPRRPRRRWVDNIKMDLREIEWIDLAQVKDQWRALVNLRVP